jgi:hypothetical protein
MRGSASHFCVILFFVALTALLGGNSSARGQTVSNHNLTTPAHGALAPDPVMQVPGSSAHPDGQPPADAGVSGQAGADAGKSVSTPHIIIQKEKGAKGDDMEDLLELIASMPEEVQQELMNESNLAKNYCERNVMLSNFYDCSCFSLKIVAARIRKGPDIPFTNLIYEGQYKECVSMPLIAGYAMNRCNDSMTMANLTTGQLTDLCECTGRAMARNFASRPMPESNYVNHLFNDVMGACRNMYGF